MDNYFTVKTTSSLVIKNYTYRLLAYYINIVPERTDYFLSNSFTLIIKGGNCKPEDNKIAGLTNIIYVVGQPLLSLSFEPHDSSCQIFTYNLSIA